MARGDVHIFAAFELKSKTGGNFTLTSDTLKIGIVTNATVPTVSTADPRWGAGGSTDFSANQVATGTAYTGPITATSVAYTRSNGVNTLAMANITVNQDAGAGFTNGYYAIIYDSTVAGNYAIGFLDLGGPVSITTGSMIITWNASGVATETSS